MAYVALGDSITVGMGDPMPDGTWRGWAALLASAMPQFEFHNLAFSGALIRDVEREQLPRALELRPAVVSVVAGVNDTLRRTFDVSAIAESMAHTIGALRAAGATVLTMRLPDPGRMFGLPGTLARPLARRIRAVNSVCDAMAARFATVHFDVAGHPSTYERPMWFVDRLHPSERGHRVLARGYCALLDLPPEQWPDSEPSSPPPTRRAQVGWMATKGTRWMVDRSQDLLPYLMRMMVAEWWYGLRDRADRLDAEIAQETAAAVDAHALPSRRPPAQPAPPASPGATQAAAAALEPPARLEPWLAPMDAPLTNSDR
jgi:lysophospholipase L1-like esterase